MKVKISCAGTTLAKDDHSNPLVTKFLPNRSNLWGGCEFYFNDSSIVEADYWVIFGDITFPKETCLCPKENILFFAGEPPSIIRYDSLSEFINQFHRIYISHDNPRHPRAFKCYSPMNWWIDSGHPIKTGEDFNKWSGDGLGYDDFKMMREYKKTKLMSVFCSNKLSTPGHKARFEFCKKAKNHFKDKLDWFGAGVQNMENKWDGVAPYKYHISLENSSYSDYWTEKLADCYMAGSYPIYCGAPNIHDYFDREMLTQIDIRFPKSSFAMIEKIIEENTYEKSKDKIIEARDLVMDKYNFFNLIAEIARKDAGCHNKKEVITLYNWDHFTTLRPSFLEVKKKSFPVKISNSLRKKFKKLDLAVKDEVLLKKIQFCSKK